MAPGMVTSPAIFIGAGDNSLQYLSLGYDYDATPGDLGDQIFRVRFEGSANPTGNADLIVGLAWEMLFDKNNRGTITIVVANLNNNSSAYRNERNPGGIYGISDGSKWVDILPSLPTFDESTGTIHNTVLIANHGASVVDNLRFVGPGVYSTIVGTTSYVKIDPLNQFGLSVGYDSLTSNPAASVISSNRYDLRLTTGETGTAVRIRPRGEAWIQPYPRNYTQAGNGHAVYILAGNANLAPNGVPTGYNGGNIIIAPGIGAGTGIKGNVLIGTASSKNYLYGITDVQTLRVNGATGWSGTYSTGDGRIATVSYGIITGIA
jgi:hypothetical protein